MIKREKVVTMSQLETHQATEVLDAQTLAALEEGLRMAAANPQRWTPEQVRADAKKMAKEWRAKLTRQASV